MEMLLFCFLLGLCTAYASVIDLSNRRDVNSTVFNPDASDPSLISTTSLLLPKLLSTGGKVGDTIVFELRDHFFMEETVRTSTFVSDQEFTMIGFTATTSFSVVYSHGCFSAYVAWQDDTTFEINNVNCSAGEYVVNEYATDLEYEPVPEPVLDSPFSIGFDAEPTDFNRILDVAFIYTPEAIESYAGGSVDAVHSIMYQALTMMNMAFDQSNINMRARIVYLGRTMDASYTENPTGSANALLGNMADPDGVFDDDIAAAAAAGADIITLFTNSKVESKYCGVGYIQAGPHYSAEASVSIVAMSCAYKSTVHEIGHNLGCNHDHSVVSNPNEESNFGYCWDNDSVSKGCHRSVMAYSSCLTESGKTRCPRTYYFSAPDNNEPGHTDALGDAFSNNAEFINGRIERATNIRSSIQPGGFIDNVTPNEAMNNYCETIVIEGWALGTGSDITSVKVGATEATIISQTEHSVTIMAGKTTDYGLVDITVTTSTGYTTTVVGMFTLSNTHKIVTTNFDDAMLTNWETAGALVWNSRKYCTDLACTDGQGTPPTSGSAACGIATDTGTGSYYRVVGTDKSDFTAVLSSNFNTDLSGNCLNIIKKFSLYYHMYTSRRECRGSLHVEADIFDRITNTVTTHTVRTATVFQTAQTDDWLKLEMIWSETTIVVDLRIIAKPYSDAETDCHLYNAIGIDQFHTEMVTICEGQMCIGPEDAISDALPTAIPTAILTAIPIATPTAIPTAIPTPTAIGIIPIPIPIPWIPPTATPIAVHTSYAAPSFSPTRWGGDEYYYTGLQVMENTQSASNAQAFAYCFDVSYEQAEITVRTFSDICYDTRVGNGDTYIRLRKDSPEGEVLGENDDQVWPGCTDSEIHHKVTKGHYCFMMGCYDNSKCSYEGLVIISDKSVRVGDTVVLDTGLQTMTDTNSASNENTFGYCFDVAGETAEVTVRSFHDECYDTRLTGGDSYIRLKEGSIDGNQIAENDDLGACVDSEIQVQHLVKGRYCFMMGCYAGSSCTYDGRVIIVNSYATPPEEEERMYTTPLHKMMNTNSGSNANTPYECFNITAITAYVIVQTYDTTCYDTRISTTSDSYIRLRKDSPTGDTIAYNDDERTQCLDSKIEMEVTGPARYCFMMGCYHNSACGYKGKVHILPDRPQEIGGDIVEPIEYLTPFATHKNTDSALKVTPTDTYCFNVTMTQATITAQTFQHNCDEDSGKGKEYDPYLRLRVGNIHGDEIAANDDVNYPLCLGSRLQAIVKTGSYCLIEGCHSDSECAYSATIIVEQYSTLESASPFSFSSYTYQGAGIIVMVLIVMIAAIAGISAATGRSKGSYFYVQSLWTGEQKYNALVKHEEHEAYTVEESPATIFGQYSGVGGVGSNEREEETTLLTAGDSYQAIV